MGNAMEAVNETRGELHFRACEDAGRVQLEHSFLTK
jgi:hypothetical protein